MDKRKNNQVRNLESFSISESFKSEFFAGSQRKSTKYEGREYAFQSLEKIGAVCKSS